MKKIYILFCAVLLLLTGCASSGWKDETPYATDISESPEPPVPSVSLQKPVLPEKTDRMDTADNDPMSAIAAQIIDASMSDYEKVKAIHDYLVIHVNYDNENLENNTLPEEAFTAEGALLKNSAVCEGYAKAFSYLCKKAGLQAELVYGTARDNTHEEYHAWNQVCVNSLWYNIDVTWDDPFLNGENISDGSNMIYDYFLVPDSALEKSHFPDHPEELHACTSSLYMEGNRERTIKPYLDELYTIVSTDEESFAAAAHYLTEHTNHFQIVFDTAPENAESKMTLVMEQVKELMESLHIYGQISIEVQYGIADYAVVTVTITQ